MFILHFISRHLWLVVAGGGVGVAGRYLRLYFRHTHRLVLPDPQVDLLRLHQSYGYNEHTLVGISPGVHLWRCSEVQGAVAYNEIGKVWLVPGDPLASGENLAQVAESFLREARGRGRVVAFMPASQRFARHSNRLGLRAVKVGSAPFFDLATWAPRGDRAKKARAGVNQARRSGVHVEEIVNVDEKLIRETASLCQSWLTTRRSAMKFGWLFAVDVFAHKERKKYFTARDAVGRLVGFVAVSPIPARHGWYLEDVLRHPDAPKGTADLLVVEVLDLLRRDGSMLATLGTAPMAMEGSVDSGLLISSSLSRLVRFVASCFSVFYNFDGVRHFKAKFAPSWWESEYILISQDVTAPLRIISAFVHAIVPAGPSTLIARQITRAWRRMKTANDAAISVRNTASIEKKAAVKPIKAQVSSVTKPQRFENEVVFVDGIKLNYVSAGSGRPVVLIHGNPGSHLDYTLKVLGRLSEWYHVVAFDRPGHGDSERHDSVETTVEVQAEIICEALRKLSIEKPVLVGHSWGGALVLAAAITYGSELSGIVLLAPAAYPSVKLEWWSLLPHVPVLGKFIVNTLTPYVGRAIVKESLREAYHPQEVHDDYAEISADMWTTPDRIRACAYDERTLRASLKVLSQHYSRIGIPVTIVTGTEDRLINPKDQAYRLHKAIKNSRLVVLPETGHQLPQTQPDAVVAAIDTVWSST